MDFFRIVLFIAVAVIGVITGIQRGNMLILVGGLLLGGIGLFSAIVGKRQNQHKKNNS
ncbi:MAG: hypothetical protein JW760_12380 [Spirochaetales bacterium]|nr:hypothetical protein [Spirochaetales bacterium]